MYFIVLFLLPLACLPLPLSPSPSLSLSFFLFQGAEAVYHCGTCGFDLCTACVTWAQAGAATVGTPGSTTMRGVVGSLLGFTAAKATPPPFVQAPAQVCM